MEQKKVDNVNPPPHYTWLKDKCGIEVIDITRHMGFCLGNAIKLLNKELDSRLYIYPKTEHTYLPIYRCKLKCPSTGEWFDAITYKGVEDKKYYVRERKDFFDKFVKLNDWKNGNKDK